MTNKGTNYHPKMFLKKKSKRLYKVFITFISVDKEYFKHLRHKRTSADEDHVLRLKLDPSVTFFQPTEQNIVLPPASCLDSTRLSYRRGYRRESSL